MTPDGILAALAARGVTLAVEGDRLRYRGRLTPADRQTIRDHKAQLLEALRRRPVNLPDLVEGVPLAEVRKVAGDDWPDLAGNPEALRQFVESCIWTGDLIPQEPAKRLEVLGRAAL